MEEVWSRLFIQLYSQGYCFKRQHWLHLGFVMFGTLFRVAAPLF